MIPPSCFMIVGQSRLRQVDGYTVGLLTYGNVFKTESVTER